MKNKKHTWGCSWILYGAVAVLAIYLLFIALWPTVIEPLLKVEWQAPDSGLWYCKELEIQLCFGPEEYALPTQKQGETHSYALIDGEPVICLGYDYHGPYSLCICNQDPSDEFHCGENIFEGKFVSLDAQNYVVRNKAEKLFTFQRISEFSVEEKTACYQKEIAQYNGTQNVGEVRHIAIAVQKATELWKAELGVDIQKEEMVVAYDFTCDCWYMSTTAQSTPNCLIDTAGNVIGVW